MEKLTMQIKKVNWCIYQLMICFIKPVLINDSLIKVKKELSWSKK